LPSWASCKITAEVIVLVIEAIRKMGVELGPDRGAHLQVDADQAPVVHVFLPVRQSLTG
jgi:hypothetical protein